jgi:hypothetical protein
MVGMDGNTVKCILEVCGCLEVINVNRIGSLVYHM